jgi:hypothetical protein
MIQSSKRLEELGLSHSHSSRNLYGVDIDADAIDYNLLYLRQGHFIRKDFLSTVPCGERTGKRLERNEIPRVHACLCNPPYTRHQLLRRTYKNRIAESLSRRIGVPIDRRASLYLYFFLHALEFLRPEGRLAFIMPSQVLETDYARQLRSFLARNYRIRAVILIDEHCEIFHDAIVSPCLFLIENSKPNGNSSTFIKVRAWSDSIWASLQGMSKKSATDIKVLRILQSDLIYARKWSNILRQGDCELLTSDSNAMIHLGSIANVVRGIATGANDVLTLSESTVKQLGIEKRFLKPVLAKASYLVSEELDASEFKRILRSGRKAWLLFCSKPKTELGGTRVLSYLKKAEKKGYHRRALTGARHPWYRTERRDPAPILFTYMSNSRPRFIYNQIHALNLNNLHGIYLKSRKLRSKKHVEQLVRILNSDLVVDQLQTVGRNYARGLLKVEPKELEQVVIRASDAIG